ncbi:MAG: MFS transporter [Dehalococcoidia bacterium]|jgi:cyanate permease
MINTQDSGKGFRLYVLILAALTCTFTVAMQQVCMTVLFKEIAEDLGLSLVQLGVIWGIPAFAGVVAVFFAGLLADRFGAIRVMSIACILSGTFGALRGTTDGFLTLALVTFFFALPMWVIPNNVFKVTATWFSGRRLVVANGVLSAGMGLGFTVGALISATTLSPLFGSWRGVVILYGGMSALIGLIWLLTVREHHQLRLGASPEKAPLRQSIARIFPLKSIWFLGLTMLGFSGCIQGLIGYLPTYLRNLGWTVASADGPLTVFSGLSMLGVIPLTLLSSKIGLKKAVLFPILVVTIVGVALVPVMGDSMVWVIMVLVGVCRDGFMAIALTISTETEGVGVVYAGTAMGLTQTLMSVGGLISPALGNSLADPANPAVPYPFFVWSAFGLLSLVAFCFVKETGWRSKPQLESQG